MVVKKTFSYAWYKNIHIYIHIYIYVCIYIYTYIYITYVYKLAVVRCSSKDLKEKDHLRDPGVDGTAIFLNILMKCSGRMWTEFIWLRIL